MTNFKFTPKLAFAIILVVVFITGVVLLLRTSNNVSKNGDIPEKSLLSFFGERKNKPLDETTVAGAIDKSGSGGSGNKDDQIIGTCFDGIKNSDETSIDIGGRCIDITGQGSGSGALGKGSLSLKPIGSNGSGGSGSSGSGGSGGNGGTGGSGSGGGTGGTGFGNDPGTGYPQTDPGYVIKTIDEVESFVPINCTPKPIEFTEEEIGKLKKLEQRFNKVAAEIRTQQDVDTLVQTRQNYYDYLSSDYRVDSRKDGTGVVELTKQCVAERAKVAAALPPVVLSKALKTTATPDGTVITTGDGTVIIDSTAASTDDGIVGGVYDGALAWVNQYEWYGRPMGMRLNPFLPWEMVETLLNTKGPVKDLLDYEKSSMTKELADLHISIFTTLPNQINQLTTDKKTLTNQIVGINPEILAVQLQIDRIKKIIKMLPNGNSKTTLQKTLAGLEDHILRNTVLDPKAKEEIVSKISDINEEIKSLSIQLSDSKNRRERLLVLLDQANKDPFSYLVNNMSYVGSEMVGYKETEVSRKNGIYYNVRSIFWNFFTWNDGPGILDKMWGGDRSGTLVDELNNASDNNPLKKEGFGNPCTWYGNFNGKQKVWDDNLGFYRCYEEYYPIQDLERVLGIW